MRLVEITKSGGDFEEEDGEDGSPGHTTHVGGL